jgi:hypothetical protein
MNTNRREASTEKVQIGTKVWPETKELVQKKVDEAKAAGISADEFFKNLINKSEGNVKVELEFDLEEYKELAKLAQEAGVSVEEYVYSLVKEEIKKKKKKEKRSPPST